MIRENLERKRWEIHHHHHVIGYQSAYAQLNRAVIDFIVNSPRTYPLPSPEDISYRTTAELEAFMVAAQGELDKRIRVGSTPPGRVGDLG